MSIVFYDPIKVHAGDQTTYEGIREEHLVHYTHLESRSHARLGEAGLDIGNRLAVVCTKSSNVIECVFGGGWFDSRVFGVDFPKVKPEWGTSCQTDTSERDCADTLQDIGGTVFEG